MIKKEYKKPKIVFEDLAFKSALATCGYVSTTKIGDDAYPCYPVEAEVEGYKGSGVPTYDTEWNVTYINGNKYICSMEYECYHVPLTDFNEQNEYYIGLS